MDPSFTRLIKLEILTALALEPASIEAVLTEIGTYIRHSDQTFACAATRSVGTVAELARIVYDRHGSKSGERAKERSEANRIALNCLHGLITMTKASQNSAVVGECVVVMQRILLQLCSGDSTFGVEDPNNVQGAALERIVLLVVNTLRLRAVEEEEKEENESDSEQEEDARERDLKKVAGVSLPSSSLASGLWIIGEWAAPLTGVGLADTALRIRSVDEDTFFKLRLELCRLLAKSFVDLDPSEKEQATHFATKVLVSRKCNGVSQQPNEAALCESLLAVGRIDPIPDVRDRARHESNLIHLAFGLQYDQENMDPTPPGGLSQKPTLDNLKLIFLQSKPASSSIPLEDVHYKQRAEMGERGGTFRFGTLSSLVGHRARSAYLPLPPWSSEDTPSSLRDPVQRDAAAAAPSRDNNTGGVNASGFYDKDDGSSSDSGSSSGSSSSGSSESDSDDSSYDGDAGSSTSSSDAGGDNLLLPGITNQPVTPQPLIPGFNQEPGFNQQPLPNGGIMHPELAKHTQSIMSDDSSESSSDSSSETSTGDDNIVANNAGGGIGDLIPMGGQAQPPMGGQLQHMNNGGTATMDGSASSVADDLRGLVLEPVVVNADDNGEPDIERDSSAWFEFVRASGLSVKARYLRGKTKTREVQLMGLVVEKPTVVCLQVRFENQ